MTVLFSLVLIARSYHYFPIVSVAWMFFGMLQFMILGCVISAFRANGVLRPSLFQIHLSTAVVLMFVAGGLLWANLEPQKMGDVRAYGWPFLFRETNWYPEADWQLGNAVVNLFVAFVNFVAALAVCEHFIRESREPQSAPPKTSHTARVVTLVTIELLLWANLRDNLMIAHSSHVAVATELGWPLKMATLGFYEYKQWYTHAAQFNLLFCLTLSYLSWLITTSLIQRCAQKPQPSAAYRDIVVEYVERE
jgi:hypothetical protein